MVALKRYCHNTRRAECLGYYSLWRDAITDLAELESVALNDGFRIQHVSDTKFHAYNYSVRFTYYLVPTED